MKIETKFLSHLLLVKMLCYRAFALFIIALDSVASIFDLTRFALNIDVWTCVVMVLSCSVVQKMITAETAIAPFS